MNMKKKLTMWVVGAIVAASTIGLGFNVTVASAAEKEMIHTAHGDMVVQNEKKMCAMDPKAMGAMMENCEMHKHCCMEMMKNPVEDTAKDSDIRVRVRRILDEYSK